MAPEDIKRMDIADFRAAGFLQEANRLFFHPHGLALEVVVHDDGSETLGGVWDYRDDSEGIIFGSLGPKDGDRADAVSRERERHRGAREALFGHGTDIEHLGYIYSDSGVQM